MSEVAVGGVGFFLLLAFMATGLHVAVAMFGIALLGALCYLGVPAALELGTQFWGASNSFVLTAIPLYVLLGELLVRGGFTDKMYESISYWVGFLPGGLLHTNIGASALFAAVSGSSVATAATISTMAIPSFKTRRFDPRLVFGTIAAGATLGILIPPSINLIVYGALTGVSVGKLYLAGFIPGFALAGLFMLVTVLWCLKNPSAAGPKEVMPPFSVRVKALRHLFTPLLIVITVMGSIYLGWATPTESAALGVVTVLVLCVLSRRLTIKILNDSLLATMGTSAMIMLIMIAAFYLTFVLGVMGMPQALADYVRELGASQGELVMALTIFYLILGCFLEALPMIIGTIPIVYPLAQTVNIDPIWFGIYLIIMCCIALITPPMGMVLYVVQGIRREGSISTVIVGVLPYLLSMIVFVGMLYIFPGIATWLPNLGV